VKSAAYEPACEVLAAGPDAAVGWTPAKVNLFLEVGGRRPDGYHAVETLIVAVNLFDSLEARRRPDGQLRLTCDAPGVPTDGTNLVMRAAEALRGDTPLGADLRLTKRIPHAAGLGGGSSDAALTLHLLNRLWDLNHAPAKLLELAAAVGSDVGVFLGGAAGWCTGRGEVVEPTELREPIDLVIVKPPYGLSTAAVYRGHTSPATAVSGHAMREAIRQGNAVAGHLHNRLEAPALATEPRLSLVRDRLAACNPLGVLLCGSGSSLFALARNPADAARIARDYSTHSGGDSDRLLVVRSLPARARPSVTPQGATQ